MRLIAGILTGAVFVVIVATGPYLPTFLDYKLNGVRATELPEPSPRAKAAQRKMFIADLHADSLLWDRDLLTRHGWGHVDVPRLAEAGVALQAFTVVTKTPLGFNARRTPNGPNLLPALNLLQGRKVKFGKLSARALEQAAILRDAVERSSGTLMLITESGSIRDLLEQRVAVPGAVGALLGLEGMHALDGKLENVDVLFQAGFRMMAPTHFFDNRLGGSAHGWSKGGITPFGVEVVKRMDRLEMIVDLAHASEDLVRDVLEVSARPPVVSHTGVRGACDTPRNLSDAAVKGIAAAGGLIGIGFWPAAVCGEDAAAIARSIRYTADLVGVEHVALGSDFDGTVTTPWDVRGLPLLTDALFAAGFDDKQVALIMGGNLKRFLEKNLPAGKADSDRAGAGGLDRGGELTRGGKPLLNVGGKGAVEHGVEGRR